MHPSLPCPSFFVRLTLLFITFPAPIFVFASLMPSSLTHRASPRTIIRSRPSKPVLACLPRSALTPPGRSALHLACSWPRPTSHPTSSSPPCADRSARHGYPHGKPADGRRGGRGWTQWRGGARHARGMELGWVGSWRACGAGRAGTCAAGYGGMRVRPLAARRAACAPRRRVVGSPRPDCAHRRPARRAVGPAQRRGAQA